MPRKQSQPQAIAPSDDPKVIERICELLGKGTPMLQILREEAGMPGPTALYARIDPKSPQYNQVVAECIARARARGFDALAEECLQIANTPLEGQEITEDDKGTSIKRGDMLGHRKLQIETRLKLLAKWDPKRYGDKLAVGGDADAPPIRTESTVTITAEDAYKRMLNGG